MGTHQTWFLLSKLCIQGFIPPTSSKFPSVVWKRIWDFKACPKESFLLWTATHDTFLIGDQLHKKGWPKNPSLCNVWSDYGDRLSYLLRLPILFHFMCNFFQYIIIGVGFTSDHWRPSSILDPYHTLLHSPSSMVGNPNYDFWSIWIERNNRNFWKLQHIEEEVWTKFSFYMKNI